MIRRVCNTAKQQVLAAAKGRIRLAHVRVVPAGCMMDRAARRHGVCFERLPERTANGPTRQKEYRPMTVPASTSSGATFDLASVERELRTEDAYLRQGHTARTLLERTNSACFIAASTASAPELPCVSS